MNVYFYTHDEMIQFPYLSMETAPNQVNRAKARKSPDLSRFYVNQRVPPLVGLKPVSFHFSTGEILTVFTKQGISDIAETADPSFEETCFLVDHETPGSAALH